MKIIDAQVHIWRQTVSPPTGKHRKVSQVTAEEMLKEMDEAGVDAALIHPPMSWDPTSQDMALEAAKKYPDRFAVMGQLRSQEPGQQGADPDLAQAARHDGPALGAAASAGAEAAARRRARLDLAGSREGRPRHRHDGRHLPQGVPRHRRALSRPQADPRPLRPQPARPGRRGLHPSRRDDGAREAAQRRGQDDRRAALFDAALSVQEHPATGCTASSTPTDPTACSGAPTSPACPAPIASASPSSPRSCRG